MTRRRRFVGTCAGLLLAAVASAQSPPAPPAGFAWKTIDSVKASFLVPEGWHFREEKADGLRTAFFITQEDIGESGRFDTGLTVNVQTLKKDPAQARAAQLIAAMIDDNQMLDVGQTESGVLRGFSCRLRKVDPEHPPLILQVLAIGNSRTNTLYLLIFESPEKDWDAAWVKGQKVLESFLLDDEI
jgi:hypothetical protein